MPLSFSNTNFQFSTPFGASLAYQIYNFDPFQEFNFEKLDYQLTFLPIPDLQTLTHFAKFQVDDAYDRLTEMRSLIRNLCDQEAITMSLAFVMYQRFYIIQTQIYEVIFKKCHDRETNLRSSQFSLFGNNYYLQSGNDNHYTINSADNDFSCA